MGISIFGAVCWLVCSLVYISGTFYLFAIGSNNYYDENDFQGDLDEEHGYEGTRGEATSIPTNINVNTERTVANYSDDEMVVEDIVGDMVVEDIVAEAPSPAPPAVKSARKSTRKKDSDVTC